MKTIRQYILTLIFIFGNISVIFGQTHFSGMDISIGNDVSGSLLGPNLLPTLDFNFGKSAFRIGPNIQEEKLKFSGALLSYRNYFTESENGNLRLFLFGNLIFQKAAYLSNAAVSMENIKAEGRYRDNKLNYSSLRLNVIEIYSGFGLNIRHTDRISTSWSIGVGYYDTLGKYDICNMYRDKSALSLIFKFALSYNLFSR